MRQDDDSEEHIMKKKSPVNAAWVVFGVLLFLALVAGIIIGLTDYLSTL